MYAFCQNYKLKVILWTRRIFIYTPYVIAFCHVLIFPILKWKWIAIPWLPIALMGTAVAFCGGFQNNASYDRLWGGTADLGALSLTPADRGASWFRTMSPNQHAKSPVPEK